MASGERSNVHDVEQLDETFLFITSDAPLVKMSASWLRVSTYLQLDVGIKVNFVKYPMQSHSVGSRNVSHRRTSAFHDHLDHCFKKMCKRALWRECFAFGAT